MKDKFEAALGTITSLSEDLAKLRLKLRDIEGLLLSLLTLKFKEMVSMIEENKKQLIKC